MRQSDAISGQPANDNPRDDRQLEMFGEPVFIGIDWGREPSIGVVAKIEDGKFTGYEVVSGEADS